MALHEMRACHACERMKEPAAYSSETATVCTRCKKRGWFPPGYLGHSDKTIVHAFQGPPPWKYPLTVYQRRLLRDEQHGHCAICQRPCNHLHVDHDHVTGYVRAMLCANCNNGLGFFGDEPERLRRAAAYLESPPLAQGPARER